MYWGNVKIWALKVVFSFEGGIMQILKNQLEIQYRHKIFYFTFK